MPIFRIKSDLHYFAHVPKCGGSSVETYLAERFGPLGFNEPLRHLLPANQLWNLSASQHIPVAALDRLIPPEWFASSFAVVRHPLRRLISAFFYSRDVFNRVPLTTDFNDWLRTAVTWIDSEPYRLAGHVLPQTAIVPEGSRIFRLEDGLEQILPYLDELAGNSDGPREIPTKNVGKWRTEEAPPEITVETLDLIAKVYAKDFLHFGYEVPTTAAQAAGLTDLPRLAATGAPPAPSQRPFLKRLQRSLRRSAGL